MRESIPIAARLFIGWKVGNSHSAQSTILGYTRVETGQELSVMASDFKATLPVVNFSIRKIREGGTDCTPHVAATSRCRCSQNSSYNVRDSAITCIGNKSPFTCVSAVRSHRSASNHTFFISFNSPVLSFLAFNIQDTRRVLFVINAS